MIARLRPWRRRDDGAAAVEFAILVPLLLLITFGIIAIGLILWAQIAATHAAREAVRRIAVNEESFTDCAAVRTYLETQSNLTIEPGSLDIGEPGSGVGDQVTLQFQVPTDQSSKGTLEGVMALFPGGTTVFPDFLTVSADTRIEEAGPISTNGCVNR